MTQGNEPNNAQEWLLRAKSNLKLAERGARIKNVLFEDLCFNAQQAAEKALKAVCVYNNLDFPKTHSIVRLLDILEAAGITIPESVKEADVLTQYAVQTRYPSWVEPVTKEEFVEALALAAKVVFWAEKEIGK
ncbi:MAG: HEPN domain-containing protein [Chloroflexi bacterium]|nr:HEPN domain-containing protein [Chloroflexota bacterium]